MDKYDVVVVGAGLAGLSAAGHLAREGKRVLVLEHHTVPGGYAHEFRRGRYRFEVALHAFDGGGFGGWARSALRDLGVLDRVRFHRLDPLYTARFPEHEIHAWADPLAYETQLIGMFPKEAKGIRALFDAMQSVYMQTRRFIEDGLLDRRPTRKELTAVYPAMVDAILCSWEDYLGEYIEDPRLGAIITSLWSYYGLPPSQLSAATFILPGVSYQLFGGYYPEGGSMAISRAVERCIVEHGGEIRYRQTVRRIHLEGDRAATVETEQGLKVRAEAVVSNANPQDTFLRMVGREHLPEDFVEQVEESRTSLSSLVVYLGLERDLRAEGWPHHELLLMPSYDIEGQYQAALRGDVAGNSVFVTHYTQHDPGAAPEGCSVVSLFLSAPWGYEDTWGTGGNLDGYGKNERYLELKRKVGDAVIARAEEALPGLREAAVHVEVATPLTNWRYSRNTEGAIYGSDQTMENTYTARLSEVTPIDNLFLTGAWVIGGGMSAALLSGRSVAHRVVAHTAGLAVNPLLTL